MVGLLKASVAACAALGACSVLAGAALGDGFGGRHEWTVDLDLGYPSVSTELEPWTRGGLGKLRFADGDGLAGNRVTAEYRGRAAPTLWVHAALGFVDDGSPGVDVTEAYLHWRPVPRSANQQALRIGAFYPPLSLENGGTAWAGSFTTSFSAINAWLAEEVRPLGVEWSLRRRMGFAGSPHELGAFAAAFYGNDPAGTLLFWRGFALHDRQTRLGDRLALPPAPIFGAGGAITGLREQHVEPFAEIDDAPGFYAGLQWRYARLALLQIAAYDNRADPHSFRDGQWSWRTKFRHLAAQLSLPGDSGAVIQWMSGATHWLIATTPGGLPTPATELVRDDFEAAYVLLTKRIARSHRVSLRYDTFDVARGETLAIDAGHAWTLAYRHEATSKIAVAVEWVAIDSARDLWEAFYGLPRRAAERQVRVHLTYRLHGPRGRSPSTNSVDKCVEKALKSPCAAGAQWSTVKLVKISSIAD